MNNDINEKIVHAAPVPPFVRFVASAVPMVFDNSLSYYEALCALWKWMQDNLVDVINNNATVTEHYIEMDEETRQLFIELKSYVDNYFDNLDVQEEINNKLDQMAEAGTLQEIITAYIQANVAWTFDTVADMKLANNLVNGSYARTLGFHTLNDGGGATYRISNTGTANEMDVIAVGSLFANLIIENTMNVNQFGAYGDSTHDDTDSIRAAINSDASNTTFMKGNTYMVTPYNENDSHGILIPSNTNVDLSQATIMVISNDKTNYKVFSFKDVANSSLKNGTILGDVSTHIGNTGEWGYGVSIIHSDNILLDNLYITKCWGDGININFQETANFDSNNITITNCICDDNRRQGMSIEAGNNIYVENCQFINTGKTLYTAPTAGVDIEPLINNESLDTIVFNNCKFINNKGMQFIQTASSTNNRFVKNLSITNCVMDNVNSTQEFCLWIQDSTNTKITNNNFTFNKYRIVLAPQNDMKFNNNIVECRDINIRTHYCQNTIIELKDNICRTPSEYKSSLGFIQNYDNNPITNRNNTVVISGNTLIDKVSGDYIYSTGMINLLPTQGIDKAIIINNYIQGSSTAISTSASSVIKDNIIVGTKDYGLTILTSQVSGTEAYFDIQNNMFYNCGSQSSIIFNYYKKNAIIRNNIYVPKYPNENIGETDYAKSSFLTYTSGLSGYTLVENNNIIALTS